MPWLNRPPQSGGRASRPIGSIHNHVHAQREKMGMPLFAMKNVVLAERNARGVRAGDVEETGGRPAS